MTRGWRVFAVGLVGGLVYLTIASALGASAALVSLRLDQQGDPLATPRAINTEVILTLTAVTAFLRAPAALLLFASPAVVYRELGGSGERVADVF